MNLPDIRATDVEGKRVLVRADLNVPVKDGEIADDSRLRAALPTLRDILGRGGRLIVIAHLDRPGGTRDPAASLRPVAGALRDALDGPRVTFVEDCLGTDAEQAVDGLGAGECLVLENLRFHAGETGNARDFADALAGLADLYVNDAFSASHRAHASIIGLPARLPAAAGLLMQKEIGTLDRLLGAPQRPYVALLGGAKAKTKVPVVEQLLDKADRILLGGVMATTFLKARGIDVGRSRIAEDDVGRAEKLLRDAESARVDLLLPTDVVVASEAHGDAEAEVVGLDRIGDRMILDIGPDTIRRYADAIEDRGTVVWNGPMGAAELEPFRQGTHFLAAAIGEQTRSGGLVSVAGGGDTAAFLQKHQFLHLFTYTSMAGGAFLHWLSGEGLPGLEALAPH
ncbi:phosphoglycerate kinase [Rhodovulum sp. 12E13]|uniref:phosphoglycerate kinase n=1 Tax=Rhodovulum sp. 12E13 TaxID=2203891 RepID=UPI000E13F54D|nr:phosphoglycerate kinase [Rhodovulum sp. 12E13]RDC67734.1 phosphoglycerate kinase [Rhodovulum sp. 12E13]